MAGAEILNETVTEPLVARSDTADRLVAADAPLAELQAACGGEIPGLIAAPDLLELVRKARGFGMRLGRPLAMRHATGKLEGWADVEPDGDGCAIRLSDWRWTEAPMLNASGEETRFAIENLLAEAIVWLDDGQRVLALESQAADLETLVGKARVMRGEHWTRLFEVSDESRSPRIWQARSGMRVGIDGSSREWQVLLTPASAGFRLLLRPVGHIEPDAGEADLLPHNLLRDELGPALHDPVRRIIRQAEAIRDRLAGPLPREYRDYAVDIVRAGKHLRELADELGDAEAIEYGAIDIASEPVRLSDTIEAACRLLQVRADARNVTLAAAPTDLVVMVDRRRVVQILLNIIGNAIDYGPRDATVAIGVSATGDSAEIRVEDEGQTLPEEDRRRMFDKFERLGRSGDSGSGLGLYIAMMLARAMGGSVEAQVRHGGGNRFVVRVPLA